MTDDLERTLRQLTGAPAHASGFEDAMWAAVARLDETAAAESVGSAAAESRVRPRRRWILLAAALVLVVVAAIAVSTRRVVQEYRQPPVASAATVVANVRHSLGTFRTLEATVVRSSAMVTGPDRLRPGWTSADWFARAGVDGPPRQISDPERIVVTADGRLRKVTPVSGAIYMTGVGPDGDVQVVRKAPEKLALTRDVPAESVFTFDDRSGVQSWYSPGYTLLGEDGGEGMGVEQARVDRGRPLGYPDLEGYSSSWLTTEGLDAVALTALSDGSVTTTHHDGRPALVVRALVTPGPVVQGKNGSMIFFSQFDSIELTVDEDTWFPLRYTTLLHGDVVDDVDLTDVRLDQPIADAAFAPAFPDGVTIETNDEGFDRVTLAEASNRFDYQPLAAATPPDGFALTDAAVASRSRLYTRTGGDADDYSWRTARRITQLKYRDGFLAFTVTTRPEEGMHDPLLADPFARDPGAIASRGDVKTFAIEGGALAGVTAKYAVPALGVPHLWAFHDGLLVTVSGDLTEGQLLDVADSLAPLE